MKQFYLKNNKKLVNPIKLVVLIGIILLCVALLVLLIKPTPLIIKKGNQLVKDNISSTTSIITSTPASTSTPVSTSTSTPTPNSNPTPNPTSTSTSTFSFSLPISDALSRVTKKPFGIYVSPKNSPVSPEHFIGYHTGVDFETTAQEQNTNVPIQAICSGKLELKKIATGYGGVAVQSCEINKEPVTVIYGHLRFSSISINSGEALNSGQLIGYLGKGYSPETSGERKHLHLGIHKGKAIDLLGYVQNKSELSQWINFF